jgi:hypothetical protein
MIKLNLPFWLSGTELKKILNASQVFWNNVEGWIQISLQQLDVKKCHPIALTLFAREKKVEQLPGETLDLHRKRVELALVNNKDAGEINGLGQILHRFGITEFSIEERLQNLDWDMISIELPEESITSNFVLLQKIIREYGRTCRRYILTTNQKITIQTCVAQVDHNQITERISL